MNRISNLLATILLILVMAGAGVGVLIVRANSDSAMVAQYNAYIDSARERAEKGINFYAKRDYLSAFSIYNEDQELFQEFLEFLDRTEDDSYRSYLKTYLNTYPKDVQPYERLCSIYYEEQSYKEIQTLLLNAAAAGVSSDILAEYWDKVEYEFTSLNGGYSNCSEFYERQAIIQQGDLKGLYYNGSGVIIEPIYDEISFYINGSVAVKKDNECYFTDLYGNKSGVFNQTVNSASIFSSGYSAVSVNGKYGYADNSLIVPEELPYEYATPFSDGIAAVKAGGKWGIIDENQKYIVEPCYDDIKLTEFGTCISCGVIFAKEGEFYIMLDAQGKRLNDYQFQEVNTFLLSAQPAAVKLDNRWTFVKTSGELFEVSQNIYTAKSYNNYLAPVTLDGELWGYMNAEGEIVIEPQFTDCKQFSEYGIAPVKKGDLWSFIQLIRYQ